MFVKTVAIPPLSLKCTTYTWKRTTRTVLPFSNSTTRDILNSATQILQACCSKLIHKKPCISFWKQNLHKRGKLWAWLKEFVYNIFRKNSNSHCSKKYFFTKNTWRALRIYQLKFIWHYKKAKINTPSDSNFTNTFLKQGGAFTNKMFCSFLDGGGILLSNTHMCNYLKW